MFCTTLAPGDSLSVTDKKGNVVATVVVVHKSGRKSSVSCVADPNYRVKKDEKQKREECK